MILSKEIRKLYSFPTFDTVFLSNIWKIIPHNILGSRNYLSIIHKASDEFQQLLSFRRTNRRDKSEGRYINFSIINGSHTRNDMLWKNSMNSLNSYIYTAVCFFRWKENSLNIPFNTTIRMTDNLSKHRAWLSLTVIVISNYFR